MTRITWTFTVLAYAITWAIVISLGWLEQTGRISETEMDILHIFGALGPFIAAIICARRFYPDHGTRKLFTQLNVGSWTGMTSLIAFSPLLLFGLGLIVYPLIVGERFSFAVTQEQFGLNSTASYLGWALPFVFYAVFEEFGWRGFLLPHLQERYSAFYSTMMLTVIWALWHIPMFWTRFDFSPGIAVGFFFGIFVGAIILTSLFNMSRGNLWAVIIFHLANNVASAFDKNYIVAVVSTGFIFLAIFILWRYKLPHLADVERVKNYFKP